MKRHKKLSVKKKIISHQTMIVIIYALFLFFWVFSICKYRKIERTALYGNSAVDFSTGWYYLQDGVKKSVQIPSTPEYPVPVDEDGFSRIYYDTSSDFIPDFGLGFFTKHQKYIVSINGQKIKSYLGENYPAWLEVTGLYFNIVEMPQNPYPYNSTVCIALYATNPSMNGIYSAISKGSRSSLQGYLIHHNIVKIVIAFLTLFIAVILLFIAFLFRKQFGKNHTIRALGYMTLQTALWLLCESCFIQIFVTNPLMNWLCDYLFFISMPLTGIYFLEELLDNKQDKILGVLTVLDIVLILTCFGLQMFRIKTLEETMIFTLIMFLVIFTYAVHCIFFAYKNGKLKNKEIVAPIIILTLGASFEIITTLLFKTYESSDVFAYSLILFYVLLGINVYKQSVQKMQHLVDSETYRKLAFIDFSTGVFNRTAYYNFVEHYKGSSENYALIVFDMNNLKTINDHYGHLYGDKVIAAFCECAQSAFSRIGKIYRVGGDEFLALIKHPDLNRIREACSRFEKNVLYQRRVQYKFNVAYGWVTFTASEPDDFFEAQKKADRLMYENKIMIKKENQFPAIQNVTDAETE